MLFGKRALAVLAVTLATGLASAQLAGGKTVQLSAGIHVITAELADTEPTRERGLMFREALAPNHGMMFTFSEHAVHCMWMRNTLIPLSVAFIDDDGTVANIEEMKPHTDDSHCARHPVQYALEMTSGWFSSRGIGPGSKLTRLDTH
jgi:uncharacterized membrane protein (UPF0127 family)